MIKNFSTLELFNIRQWLLAHSNSVSISSQHVRDANSMVIEVDKELWNRIISNNTPWGLVERNGLFEDKEFEKTIQSVRDGSITI
jgi:hypothetical protein